MRKILSLLFLVIVISSGCSSQTLQDAINKSDYADYDKPEILYHNDDVGVVIFLTKDYNGNFIICRSSYEKNSFDRYVLDTNDDVSMAVDIGKQSEFIQYDRIENEETPLNIVWGGVFHYPGAKQVAYKIHSDNDMLFESMVEINKKHVFVDVLAEDISASHSISFDVIDKEGNVLFSFN